MLNKFKVLKVNQDYMTWLGIYARDLTETTNPFFKSIGAYWILGAMTICVIASWVYVREFWTIDVKSALGALKILAAGIQCFGMFLSVGLTRSQTRAFHVALQKIVDQSKFFFHIQKLVSKCIIFH